MAFALISRGLLRTSRELLERNVAVGAVKIVNNVVDIDINYNSPLLSPQRTFTTSTVALSSNARRQGNSVMQASRLYNKKVQVSTTREEEAESESESDDDYTRENQGLHPKAFHRGESEFWRRKMRTLHRILDVNRDGVVSFDDFNLLAKRFTDLGHLTPEVSAEFLDVMKRTWEEQFGEISPYNVKNADQFLADLHNRLNDEEEVKSIGRFLPYLFKAVDYDHSGHLDLEQFKLFFRCLGLSDEDAAISFAVIDTNSDGEVSLKEFVQLGRQFFLTEDETKISKMFWGPLIDH